MRRASKISRDSGHPAVPVTLPLVVATVQDDDNVQVTVNGVVLVEGPIARDALGRVLSAIAEDQCSPIRAEVREVDGRVFADIITPPIPRVTVVPATAQTIVATTQPALVEFTGAGFLPGEDVAVAVIVSHSSATGTGDVRAVLEQSQLGDAAGVLLFGEISGTLVRHGARP